MDQKRWQAARAWLLACVFGSLALLVMPAYAAAKKAVPSPIPSTGDWYRRSDVPDWVRPVPDLQNPRWPGALISSPRLDLLADTQVRLDSLDSTRFMRSRQMAIQPSAVPDVARLKVRFNPARQTLSVHGAWVERAGVRMDALSTAEVSADGDLRPAAHGEGRGITLNIGLADVQVGDVVEFAYSVMEPRRPDGPKFAMLMPMSSSAPVAVLSVRVMTADSRMLRSRMLAEALEPQVSVHDGMKVLTWRREELAPQTEVPNVPLPVPTHPMLQLSEWTDWQEVAAWAQRMMPPPVPGSGVLAEAERIRSRTDGPKQAAAEALRFVQDDIRQISTAAEHGIEMAESPEQTLRTRLGSRFDRNQLLASLLTALKLDARPALVSGRYRDGLDAFLPAHDLLDHAVMRLSLEGEVYNLDARYQQQGLTLDSRAYDDYRRILVLGSGRPLEIASRPASHRDESHVLVDWNLSRTDLPAELLVRVQGRGVQAELWREALAQQQRIPAAQLYFDSLRQQFPGLRQTQGPTYADDRRSNVLDVQMRFEHPAPGPAVYRMVAQQLQLTPHAIQGVSGWMLGVTKDRPLPFQLPAQRAFEYRFQVTGPSPLRPESGPVVTVHSPHFKLLSHVEAQGRKYIYDIRLDWLGDVVPVSAMSTFHQQLGDAIRQSSFQLALPLYENAALVAQEHSLRQKMAAYEPMDALWNQLFQMEGMRMACSDALTRVAPGSQWALNLRVDRSKLHVSLGDAEAALADAQAALEIDASDRTARISQGVALVALGRFDEALHQLDRLPGAGDEELLRHRREALMGLERYAEAAEVARQALLLATGPHRSYALLSLYQSAEAAAAGGGIQALKAMANPPSGSAEWGDSLVAFLRGDLDQAALLAQARSAPDLTRLRLAEATYYIGLQRLHAGRESEAVHWFEQTVATQAIHFTEYRAAQRALTRLRPARPG